jgi:NADH dehydrogenase/NADH:ubiquinone oxidoreductase subunit G
LANAPDVQLAARKIGVDVAEIEAARKAITGTQGDVVIMFGGELSAAAQACVAQMSNTFTGEGRRVLLHPLPLYNNSIGAHDILGDGRDGAELLRDESVRAVIIAGTPMTQLGEDENLIPNCEFIVLSELFPTAASEYADVIFPAASFAEVDGTFTNNDGFVQRVRRSVEPVHQARADWLIATQLAAELGANIAPEMSASTIFREIGERVPPYSGLRYPLLKDESKPVQVKHEIVSQRDLSNEFATLRKAVEAMDETANKEQLTPGVGHELFKLGTLMEKTPQIHLLAAGNPKPENILVSPLYQISIDEDLRREAVVA